MRIQPWQASLTSMGVATIEKLSVTGATADYILVELTASMTNPSQITITLGTINFDVVFGSSNTVIGKVYLNNLTITPGTQSYAVEMHLGEGSTDQAAVGSILTAYLTNQNVPLTIVRSETSTDIAPLKTGLEHVTLATSMQGIQANLVTHVTADINLDDIITATGAITIYNPLDTPFSILSVKATTSYKIVCTTSGNEGTDISVGAIDYTLPEPATIQPKETQTFNGWPFTGIDLLSSVPMVQDPYATISLNQVVVTLVDNVYNTGEIAYTESGVPISLTVAGGPFFQFDENYGYYDDLCQCARADVAVTLAVEDFKNQTTCLDGKTPVVYRNVTVVTHPDTLNATLASNTTTPALNETTTLAPTNATSTAPVTTTDSTTTTLLTTTAVPATTEDSATTTTTDSSSDPTTTEEPAATPETQMILAETSAPTDS